MPTYEYACGKCGHEFERFQSILAEPVKKCPECGKNAVIRKIGIGGAVLFKGGGFYETDYRSEGYKSAADADKKAAEGKPDSKSAAKPDSKPEAKSEAKSEATSEATSESKPESKSESKPESKPEPKPDAAAAAAENKRIEARATHQSRIGRGVGNIVKKKAPAKKKR